MGTTPTCCCCSGSPRRRRRNRPETRLNRYFPVWVSVIVVLAAAAPQLHSTQKCKNIRKGIILLIQNKKDFLTFRFVFAPRQFFHRVLPPSVCQKRDSETQKGVIDVASLNLTLTPVCSDREWEREERSAHTHKHTHPLFDFSRTLQQRRLLKKKLRESHLLELLFFSDTSPKET